MPMCVAEYGWPPELILLLGKLPFPHSKASLPFPQLYAPPLATSKTSSDVFGCSVANITACQNCQRNTSVRLLIKEFCVCCEPLSTQVPCSHGRSLLSSLMWSCKHSTNKPCSFLQTNLIRCRYFGCCILVNLDKRSQE